METNEICLLVVLSPFFVILLWGMANVFLIVSSLVIVGVIRGIATLRNTWFEAVDLVQSEWRKFKRGEYNGSI